MSSSRAARTAPSRINWWGPADSGLSTRPGRAKTGRPWSSQACRAVMSAPLRSSASTTSTPRDIPLTIRLRRGKFSCIGGVPSGYSLTTAPRGVVASAPEPAPEFAPAIRSNSGPFSGG